MPTIHKPGSLRHQLAIISYKLYLYFTPNKKTFRFKHSTKVKQSACHGIFESTKIDP